MNLNQEIKKIRNLIAHGDLENAIDALRSLIALKEDTSLENEVVMYNRRYNELLKNLRLGLITKGEESTEYNKIAHALLELVNITERTESESSGGFTIAKSEEKINKVIQTHFGTGDIVVGGKVNYFDYPGGEKYKKFLTLIPTIGINTIIGRNEEVKAIDEIFKMNAKILLSGLGGIGKTTTAVKYINDYKEKYDHILWLNLHNGFEDAILTDSILLKNLSILFHEAQSLRERIKVILGKLNRLGNSNVKCLMVLDDVEESGLKLKSFIPDSPHWKILILSRQSNLLKEAYQFTLSNLSLPESLELFYNSYNLRDERNDEAVKEIVEAVEYHPLAIQLLAKTGEKSRIPLSTLASLLQERGVNFMDDSLEEPSELSSLLLGFLEISSLNPDEIILLKNYLVLPDSTPIEYLVQKLNKHNKQLLSTESLNTALVQLTAKGWLLRKDGSHLLAHKLIKEIILSKLLPSLEEIIPWIDVVNLELYIDQSKDNPVDKAVWIPFAEEVLELFPNELHASISNLKNGLALLYKAIGEYDNAILQLEQAIKIDLQIFGQKSVETSQKQSNLATLYQDVGQYEKATELAELALSTDLELQGENNESVAVRRANLAVIYRDIGEYEKAITLLEKALETDKSIYEGSNPNIAITSSNLAAVYRSLGRYEDAIKLYKEALDILEVSLGKQHPNISTVKGNLAQAMLAIGDTKEAKLLFEESLTIDLNNFGEQHPLVATTYSNLANVYEIEGELDQAYHFLKKAIDSDVINFGEQHPTVAIKKSNLANIYQKQGKYELARTLLNEALEVNIKAYGANTPEIANSLANLAQTNKALGNYEEAIELFEEAGRIYQKNFGPNHRNIIKNETNLASVYLELGDYNTARRIYELSFNKISQLKEENRLIDSIQTSLAFIYKTQGDFDKSIEIYNSLHKNYEEVHGKNDPRTHEVLSELALIFEKQGDLKKAEELWNSALRPVHEAKVLFIGESNYGKTHLIEILRKGEISREIKTTHGIERNNLPIKYGKDEIKLNLWDLGGQEFMHTTHQFFFTERALYVLVTLARKERRELKYWLDLVDKLGDSAPVLIVIHQIDVDGQDIDRASLQREYPNIVGFVRTTIYDCDEILASDAVQNLKTKIINTVTDSTLMPGVFQRQRPGFFAVKNAIEGIEKEFITFQEFEDLERVQHLSSDEKKSYLRHLNMLGTVVSFVDHVRLIDTNVIKPQWILDGIYKVINDRTIKDKNNGKFHIEEISRILNDSQFPIHRHAYLIGLMEKFLLCFPLGPDRQMFLLPDLLSNTEPSGVWNSNDSRKFRIQYHDFEPRSIITQFIVSMHNDIKSNYLWRSGVILCNGKCEAKVYSIFRDNLIYIELVGTPKERLRYRYVIENVFEKLHNYYPKLQPEQEICYKHPSEDIWLNYEDIITHKEYSQPMFNSKIKETIPLDLLLDEYPPSESTTEKIRKENDNTKDSTFNVTVYGGMAVVGNKQVQNLNVDSGKEDIISENRLPSKKAQRKYWWAYRLLISFFSGLVIAYLTNKYLGLHFYDTWLSSFSVIALALLARNPNRKFLRAAYFVLGILGTVNFLPQFDILINSKTEGAEGLKEWYFQLGVQDEPILSAGLLILAGFLFYLDSTRD